MEFWWRTIKLPMRRVWRRVGTRLGIRKSGLLKLRQDVRTCEYEDVHVMWGILSEKSETIRLGGERPGKKKRFWNFMSWVKRAPSVCRAF